MNTTSRSGEKPVLVADNELLGKFLVQGDESAFEEIVRRHAPMVMGLCRSLLLHSQDAEDAFQATFLVLSRKAKRLLNRGSIAGWLYQVALRNCLEIRRRRGRARESEMRDEVTAKTKEPWRQITSTLEHEQIHSAIQQLPEHYREAIVMCHLNGYSRSEAAELLGKSENAVKALLARGRNILRQKLVRKGIVATTLLIAMKQNSARAVEYISEPLLQSTFQICKGTNSQASLTPNPEFIQTIANTGAQTMNTATIFKATTCLALLASAIAFPAIILAQQSGLSGTTSIEFAMPSSDSDSGTSLQTISAIDNAPSPSPGGKVADQDSDGRKSSLSGDDEDQAQAKDRTAAGSAENGNVIGQETKSAEDRLFGNAIGQDAESDEYQLASKFSIHNSANYWKLLLQSHQARLDHLKSRPGKAQMLDLAEIAELRANVFEAQLNIKRIETGILTTTDGKLVPKSKTAASNSKSSNTRGSVSGSPGYAKGNPLASTQAP